MSELADSDNPYLKGFGTLAHTDIPELMKRERERARKEWGCEGETENAEQ